MRKPNQNPRTNKEVVKEKKINKLYKKLELLLKVMSISSTDSCRECSVAHLHSQVVEDNIRKMPEDQKRKRRVKKIKKAELMTQIFKLKTNNKNQMMNIDSPYEA